MADSFTRGQVIFMVIGTAVAFALGCVDLWLTARGVRRRKEMSKQVGGESERPSKAVRAET